MSTEKKVAIIGAGPAGLCAAKHLLYSNTNAHVTITPYIFEQNDVVGGTWVYEDIGGDNEEVFSSVYKNLKTNLPRQVMGFPDFPFQDSLPSYVHHSDVLRYIENYAASHHLMNYIRFNTKVIDVTPMLSEDEYENEKVVKWKVTSKHERNVKSKDNHKDLIELEEAFDAIIVCNGHFSLPSYPSIIGLENFSGKVIHSHYYREPAEFSDKSILILGCGPSALDIMSELSRYSTQIYLSHRGKELETILPDNVIQVPNISYVNEDGQFVFEDSTTASVDIFLQCTGYSLNLPFLSLQCNVIIKDNSILNLYKHIFNIRYPSLCFVGLTWQNCPLVAFHQQCLYITKIISGTKRLPSLEEMSRDTDRERLKLIESGKRTKDLHRLGETQWDYYKEIATLANIKEISPVIERLYNYAMSYRRTDVSAYKDRNYKVINDFEFVDLSIDI